MNLKDTEQQRTPYQDAKEGLIIRSFQHSDQKECQQMFRDGFQEFIKTLIFTILSTSLRYVGMATIFIALAAMMWSKWIFVVFVSITYIPLTFLCVILLFTGWRALKNVSKSDMGDIAKSYMTDDGSHMWVAEWRGKVVGMVGLIHKRDHKPGVFELQRMYVVPHCQGMGIGKKMLVELITHAKKHRIYKITLRTTFTQKPAIHLYMKYGFKPTTRESHHYTAGRSLYSRVGAGISSFLAKYFMQLELLISSAKVS